MSTLRTELEAYESLKADLELSAMGKWVVVRDGKPINTYESFEDAAEDAVAKFGAGPYLIRQIGESSVTLSASVMYRFA